MSPLLSLAVFWVLTVCVLILCAYVFRIMTEGCSGRFHAALWTGLLFTCLTLPGSGLTTYLFFPLVSLQSIDAPGQPWLAQFIILWGAGLVWLAVQHGYIESRARQSLRQANPIDDEVFLKVFERIKTLLFIDYDIQVKSVGAITIPFIKGFFRPVLYIPDYMLFQVKGHERAAVIAHELAHVSRYDHVVHSVMRLFSLLFWFLPPVWFVQQELYQDQDRACDECASAVLGNRIRYAKALTHFAARQIDLQPNTFHLSFSHRKTTLFHRIKSILQKDDSQLSRLNARSKFILILAFCGYFAMSGLLAQIIFPASIAAFPQRIRAAATRSPNAKTFSFVYVEQALQATMTKRSRTVDLGIPALFDPSNRTAIKAHSALHGFIDGQINQSNPTNIQWVSNQPLHPGDLLTLFIPDSQNGASNPLPSAARYFQKMIHLPAHHGSGILGVGPALPSDVISDTDTVLFADLNLDGNLDLIEANKHAPNLIRFGNGNGDFSMCWPLSDETFETHQIIAFDADQDGDLDLAEVNGGYHPNFIHINDGKGFFPKRRMLGSSFHVSTCVEHGDLDGDGDLDLIIGNYDTVEQFVSFNNGHGEFLEEKKFSDVGGMSSIGISDLDNDGDLDVAIGTNPWENNMIYINDGTGAFEPLSDFIFGGIQSLKFADLNNDGFMDLVTRGALLESMDHFDLLTMHFNVGDNYFKKRIYRDERQIDRPLKAQDVEIADMNGDGNMDLLIAMEKGVHLSAKNVGADRLDKLVGAFPESSNHENGYSICAGDVDNDGDLDVVVGTYNGFNQLYLNQ